MNVKKICGTMFLCLLLGSVASAHNSTSPQGGTAVYDGAAACVGSSFQAGSNTGLLRVRTAHRPARGSQS